MRTAAESLRTSQGMVDPAVLAQRKSASARRLQTLQIPAIRTGGFIILCVIAVLLDPRAGEVARSSQLTRLLALNLA